MLLPTRLAAQPRPAACLQAPSLRRAWRRPRQLACRAQGAEGEAGLSLSEAYAQLGVSEGASFDECLRAKNAMLARFDGNEDKCKQIEQAYDRIFMQQMSARLRGELPVSSKVRFADVPTKRPAQKAPQQKNPLSSIPGGLRVATPRGNDLTLQAGVFGGLAAWALIQDWVQPANVDASQAPTTQLAIAAIAAVYFLREQKRAGLGKAAGLAVGGLVLGALLGSLVENWLRVDIVPLGGISAPGTVVGEFALAGLAAVSILLA